MTGHIHAASFQTILNSVEEEVEFILVSKVTENVQNHKPGKFHFAATSSNKFKQSVIPKLPNNWITRLVFLVMLCLNKSITSSEGVMGTDWALASSSMMVLASSA